MASSDFTELSDSISSVIVRRGVTGGATPPNGGDDFVYGMHSVAITTGAVALFTNQDNFAPTPTSKGGSVRGAVLRATSAGSSGFQPFLWIGGQGTAIADNAYLLGLTDGDPFRIVLVKGPVVSGCPDAAPGSQGVLRRSTSSFAVGAWLHLRLDMQVNQNGDVVLSVFRNDLEANAVDSPSWAAVAGLEQFIDDALSVNSGSAPYTNGRMGFGARFSDTHRRVYFDHIECLRQL